jgi:iron complex outermembrane receptor protein
LPTQAGQSPTPAGGNRENKQLPIHKETIAVTGTFAPVPVEDIDRAISVIDTREQPLLYTHWVDYLQLDPSVDLQQRAPDGVQADLTIRGSTFEQTLVLMNGLRMDDVETSHHDMDLPLPTSAIERIEVLPGAGSIFYGSDATGGTVNFITGIPQYSQAQAGAAIGNFGTNQETFSAGFVASRVDEQLDVARDFSTGFMPGRDYRSLTIFSNTGAQTALGRSLIMLGLGDKPFGANNFYGDSPTQWERTKSWFAALKQDLGKKTELDLSFRRHTDEYIWEKQDPSLYENNHIDHSLQGSLRRAEQLGQNSSLFYGVEGFYESINSNNLGDHHRTHSAGYIDYDVRALSRFSFSAGAREEVFDVQGSKFSPYVSGGVWLKPGLKLKASASRAFRLPSYVDLDYNEFQHNNPYATSFGNANLLPENSWGYEGGLLWDQGGHYKAEVTVFERRDSNDIDWVALSSSPVSPSNPYNAQNIARLNFTGAEATFGVRVQRQQFNIAYTRVYSGQNLLPGLVSEYVFNYASHNAVVSWQGMLPGKVVARSRIGVVQRYANDPYALWDASVGREFKNVSAHLAFANLTNTGYQEIPGVAMPGRSVVFGMDVFVRRKR